MLILLPPSEAKNAPESGSKFALAKLSFSKELTSTRTSASLMPVAQKPSVWARPAHEIYSGVLYQALGWETLSVSAQKRGEKSLVIISALFGAIRINDVIPSYKLKIKSALWKLPVAQALDSLKAELIIDCRSSTYAGVWNSDPSKTVAIRVFKVSEGKRSVITHMSKKYRGELTRYLLENKAPKTPQDVAQVAAKYFDCDLVKSDGINPWMLDLLISM